MAEHMRAAMRFFATRKMSAAMRYGAWRLWSPHGAEKSMPPDRSSFTRCYRALSLFAIGSAASVAHALKQMRAGWASLVRPMPRHARRLLLRVRAKHSEGRMPQPWSPLRTLCHANGVPYI